MKRETLPSPPEARTHRAVALAIAAAVLGCTAISMWTVQVTRARDAGQIPEVPQLSWVRGWIHWDSGWYAHIAQVGYWYKPGHQSPVAFFPVYPKLVGAVHTLGVDRYLAGILVTLVCGVLASWLVYRWARQLVDERTAYRACLLLLFYPFAFYLYGVMYSDALFLLLVVGAFYALERRWLWLAVLLGAIATAARPVAPAVVLGLLVRQLELRKQDQLPLRWVDFTPVLAATGLGLYMAYLGFRFGDPMAFANVQAAPGWDHVMGWRSWLKLPLWTTLAEGGWRQPSGWLRVFHGALALGALALAWPTARRLGWGYGVYVAVVVGIPALSSKDFQGLGRYLLAAFPVFLTLALLTEKRRVVRWVWLTASALLLFLLTQNFARGMYVA